MQARIKKSSRYGTANLFSGIEFVKFEFRKVPNGFEDQARVHELLEIREGKAEKEVVEKQVKEAERLVMKARLVADYKDESLRTLSGREYVKTEWRDVPDGFEASARAHELLEIWEAGAEEPTAKVAKTVHTFKKVRKIGDDTEGKG